MIGVLDRDTMKMSLHKAELFNMIPSIKGKLTTPSNLIIISIGRANTFALENDFKTERLSGEQYSSAFDKMVSSFGSAKARKSWSASKRNRVEGEVLDLSLTPAMKHAENVIQQIKEQSKIIIKSIANIALGIFKN